MFKYFFFILFFLISLSTGHAIASIDTSGITQALPYVNDSKDTWEIIASIIAWMISMTAILSVIAITWASIQMVLATGEDEKIKKSRYMIIYAFIWLTLAGLAYAIVRFIGNIDFTII
jgi:hypothetical protein